MKTSTLNESTVLTLEKSDHGFRQVAITCPDNFLIHNRGCNYYSVDISSSNVNELNDIINACETVENSTWKAQEDFYEYFGNSDLLIYAEKGGQIVGFTLYSIFLINRYCFFTNNETMVLRGHQDGNIALTLVTTSYVYFMKKIQLDKSIKKVIYVSISATPKVVNGYYKNKYMSRKFTSSFNPSDELVSIHRAYLERYDMSLVDPRYPFAVKNVFPGSQQVDWNNRRNQFCESVKNQLPPDFDHKNRGDAWAFMFIGKLRKAYVLFTYMALSYLGMQVLFNKNMGLLRRKKNLLANPKIGRIRLIDGKFSDRRVMDRRITDRRVYNNGANEYGIDCRLSDRRNTSRREAV
jgi:hypothetical protein